MKLRWLPLLLILLASGAHAESDINNQSFDASYAVSLGNVSLGTLEIRYRQQPDGSYEYHGTTNSSAYVRWVYKDVLTEVSKGKLINGLMRPDSFEMHQTSGKKTKKHTLLEFDWDDEKLWTTSEEKRWSQVLPPDTHDKLSQQQALRSDLAAGKQQVRYQVADGGKIKSYEYRVAANEPIQLPLGHLDTILVRRNKINKPQDFAIWIAPELNYMPVVIERERSVGMYRMELVKYQPLPTTQTSAESTPATN